jgi:peroxiredoxin
MKALTHINLASIVFASLFLTPGTSLGIEVGDKAPTFVAESTHGVIHLADFAGKKNVILALYFAIFTPV